MSRLAFGGWGWQLSDRDFGRALAALGVLAPYMRSGDDLLSDAGSGGTAVAAGLSHELVVQAMSRIVAASGWRLRWDLGDVEGLRPELEQLPAESFASAWLDGQAGHANLEIAPAPGLDDRWTYELLAHATAGSPPHFSLPQPSGRLRWNWPTRVGFLPEAAWFRDDLYQRLSTARLRSPSCAR